MQGSKTLLNSYNDGLPLISDAEYDLVMLNDGTDTLSEVGDSVHLAKLGSMRKIYEGEDAVPDCFIKSNQSPKLDGIALCLTYNKGKLVKVATRGDGWKGTDVTEKFIVTNQRIILEVENLSKFQVTGELVCPSKHPNARNIVAGAITHLKNPSEYAERSKEFEFQFVAYDSSLELASYSKDTIPTLRSMGFLTVFDDVSTYPTDGLVYRLDNNQEVEELGFTGNYKNGLLALKVRKEGVETTVESISWQLSPKGVVTPVANLVPIDIDGAIVSKVTLNNADFLSLLISNKGFGIGSTVSVIRAGEIIPKIVNILGAATSEIVIPDNCPCCNTSLIQKGAFLVCPNKEDCPAQVAKLSQTFFSTLGVKGLGIKTCEKIGKTPVEILKLSEGQICDIIGSTVGKKIFLQLEELKKGVTQELLLQAMSIPMVGKTVSPTLPSVKEWRDTIGYFNSVLGTKRAVANSLYTWYTTVFQDIWLGEWPLAINVANSRDLPEETITVVATGSIAGYSRTTLTTHLAQLGVKVASTVNKKTAYLLCETESSSSSVVKAKELNIPIITLKTLESILNDN